MEIDTIADTVGSSLFCVGTILEGALLFLGTTGGHASLHIFKLVGFVIDVIGLKVAFSLEPCDNGYQSGGRSGVFMTMVTLFVFDRILTVVFILRYASGRWCARVHPPPEFDEYARRQIEDGGGGNVFPPHTAVNTDDVDEADEADVHGHDDKLVAGLRTLWYGSLWNASDFVGQIYKITPYEHSKCVAAIYFFYILLLTGLSYMFVITTRAQNNSDGSYGEECHGSALSVADATVLCITMIGVQIGLLQHTIAFGKLWFEKKGENTNDTSFMGGRNIKAGAYSGGVICFVIMMMLIIMTFFYVQ